MNARKLFVSGVAVSLLGLAPALFSADSTDTPAPPPDGNAPAMNQPAGPSDGSRKDLPGRGGPGQHQFGGERQGFGFMPRGPMSEEDMAKFKDLGQKLKDAVEDYRKSGDEKNKAAVKAAVTALVDAQQKFEIDRAEKALARAKAKVQEKDKIVDRIVDRVTSAKADKPGPKGERPHGGKKGERPAAPQAAPDQE